MVRRGYVVGSVAAVAVLVALVLSSTAARPLFGSDTPFTSTQPLPSQRRARTGSLAVGTDDSLFPHWVFLTVMVLLSFYALCLLLLVLLHRRRRADPPEPRSADTLDDEDDSWQALLTAELADATAEQLAEIGLGTARDAIIACWMRLHAATQRVGLEAAPAETPQEYTERTLRRLRVDAGALNTLAALYREARFSEHQMDDGHRQQAAAALHLLASQLAGRLAPA